MHRRGLANEIADGDTELIIVSRKRKVNAYTGISRSAFIENDAGLHPNIFKCPIAQVAPQTTGRAVTGDKDIEPAIVVQIKNGRGKGTRT